MGDQRFEADAAGAEETSRPVPGVPQAPAGDALKGEALEDQPGYVEGHRAPGEAEDGDATAVAGDPEGLVERLSRPGHLLPDVDDYVRRLWADKDGSDGTKPGELVADRGYGTTRVYAMRHKEFVYVPELDRYRCPRGKWLTVRRSRLGALSATARMNHSGWQDHGVLRQGLPGQCARALRHSPGQVRFG